LSLISLNRNMFSFQKVISFYRNSRRHFSEDSPVHLLLDRLEVHVLVFLLVLP